MRKMLLELYDPPYVCFFCQQPIVDLVGNGARSINTHHIDENHNNNDRSNLTAAHKSCHTRHHFAGKKKSYEHRIRIAEALLDNTNGSYGRAGKPTDRAARLPRGLGEEGGLGAISAGYTRIQIAGGLYSPTFGAVGRR